MRSRRPWQQFMREQRKSGQKERNVSVWLTGIVLALVYMILLDVQSGTKENACRGILSEPVLLEAADILDQKQGD